MQSGSLLSHMVALRTPQRFTNVSLAIKGTSNSQAEKETKKLLSC